ncbi:MAG: nitroreductase family protein [bacterium]|nr:nitroreductase family protein [bacterium]
MTFNELAKARYSCRKFSGKTVEKEKIDYILRAAQLAPTAVNFQPQKIYVITSADALTKINDCTKYGFNAPINFLVCYDKNTSWKRGYDGEDFGSIDASIVITHMMLAATEQGLGSTWVGSFDPSKVREAFDLPENIIPVSFLPIGYPADDAHPAHLHDKRRELSETVTFI